MRCFAASGAFAIGGVPFFGAPGLEGLLGFASAVFEAAAFRFVFVCDELGFTSGPLAGAAAFAAGDDLLFDAFAEFGLGVVGRGGGFLRGSFCRFFYGGFAGGQSWASVHERDARRRHGAVCAD